MLVGASFCLIFKSHTKALMFISEKASSVAEFCEVPFVWDCDVFDVLLECFPFPVSDTQYFSSDFRYVMTVFSEYLR